MEMSADPCNVCGVTDTKLIDGYYYCIECGTQNTNVRETIIEDKLLADGTFGITQRKKITKIRKHGIEMSEEWYKWHAYNFVIVGLADDLISLGAKPTFKTKLLWIWTRYIKKYQVKSELTLNKTSQDNNDQTALSSFMADNVSKPEEETSNEECNKKKKYFDVADGSKRDIKFLSKSVIIAMLYVALNLDESDIQLSHLYRYCQEKQLNLSKLNRYVPADIDCKKIFVWQYFLRGRLVTQHLIRALAVTLFRKLDLGTPKVPDLKKIVDNFLSELSLPNDLKPFVYSLLHYRRCDYFSIDKKTLSCLIRIPDYEGTVMAYILVALKMCFGLDCDFEIKLSNIVERINEEKNLQKSHKIGKYSEPTDRLFSFREWITYLRFRKVMLGKYNLRIAEKYFLDINDCVYLEQMEERPKNTEQLTDKISMEIIGRLPLEDNEGLIPKELFIPTLTPLSDYTDVVVDHCQDIDQKLLLAEDFKKYSLKYACKNLSFCDSNFDNIIRGVSEDGKTKSDNILGTMSVKKAKTDMVYVKNCENRNWMTTKPPTMEHVTSVIDESEIIDKDSDHGYDSECTPKEKDIANVREEMVTDPTLTDCSEEDKSTKNISNLEIIAEEDVDVNIFDDCFEDITIKEECEKSKIEDDVDENEIEQIQNDYVSVEDFDVRSNISTDSFVPIFNPDTFDRSNTIRELILLACQKYKIPVPSEYKTKEPRKRIRSIFGNEGSSVKRRRRAKYDGHMTVNDLLSNYYNYVQSDSVTKVQQEINLAIRNTELAYEQNNDVSNNILDRNSTEENRSNSHIDQSDGNDSIGPVDQQFAINITDQTDIYDKTDVIDENLENELFKNDEKIILDDLIPKGDPKFDEEKYYTDQLYLKIKDIPPDTCFDIKDDAEIDAILFKNSKQSALSAESAINKPKSGDNTEESDSEDEIPLSAIKSEIMMIKDMFQQEKRYERLIKNENIPEFKYWVRHYNKRFMVRSREWYVKFNEELKENVPSSFYFVLQECASILTCSNFYLYKNLQSLEEYFICKSKKGKCKIVNDCFEEEPFEDTAE